MFTYQLGNNYAIKLFEYIMNFYSNSVSNVL